MNSSLISKSMPILSVDLSAKSSAVNPNWLLTGFRSSIDSDKFDTNWRNLWAFWHRSANVLILLSSEKQWLQIHISFVNSCNENYRIRFKVKFLLLQSQTKFTNFSISPNSPTLSSRIDTSRSSAQSLHNFSTEHILCQKLNFHKISNIFCYCCLVF